jgi:hypothetical protein
MRIGALSQLGDIARIFLVIFMIISKLAWRFRLRVLDHATPCGTGAQGMVVLAPGLVSMADAREIKRLPTYQ